MNTKITALLSSKAPAKRLAMIRLPCSAASLFPNALPKNQTIKTPHNALVE